MDAEALAKRAYKQWIRRMDPHWKTNYPKWKNLNARSKIAWTLAAEIFIELING